MDLKEQIYSILIVSASENINNALFSLLPESKYGPVRTVSDISAAKRALLERNFDFIIINSPLPDDSGISFAIDAGDSKNTVVLLLVRSELYEETRFKTEKFGVFTLAKPSSKSVISLAFSWMAATREKLRKYEKKTLTIEEKMKEIRIVNRAKWILISELKMSEPDAHRYIEKQAMDQCVSKTQVAETIIKTYS